MTGDRRAVEPTDSPNSAREHMLVNFPVDSAYSVPINWPAKIDISFQPNRQDIVLLFFSWDANQVLRFDSNTRQATIYDKGAVGEARFQVRSANLTTNYSGAVTILGGSPTDDNGSVEGDFSFDNISNKVTISIARSIITQLTGLSIQFATGGDDKDHDTELFVSLRDKNGRVLAYYNQGLLSTPGSPAPGSESTSGFPDGSDVTKNLYMPNPVRNIDSRGASLSIGIRAHGPDVPIIGNDPRDTWKFQWRLHYTWENGASGSTDWISKTLVNEDSDSWIINIQPPGG